jgi:thiamine biosynthesis protein ThiS
LSSADTIQITLNGKENEIKSGMTVTDLLDKWRMRPELVTVELNENIIQKLDYENTEIKTGDKIEFIFYMGGGAKAS